VNLLPYHKIAQTKYEKLGRGEAFVALEEPTKERLRMAVDIFRENGIEASVGG